MFLSIEAEVSTETIMKKMLQSHSLNYVLYLALKTYGYEPAEFLSDKMTKIVEECDE
jgi:hypothetical protein